MEKAYKFQLYPTTTQEELIRKTIGCSRFVYNKTLAARKDAYSAGSSISGYDCVKLLPGLKDAYPWLREVDSWQHKAQGPSSPAASCVAAVVTKTQKSRISQFEIG